MLTKGDLQEILDLALQRGGDFSDIYIENKKTTGIACEADKVERLNTGIDIGAGIRVISGETTAYAYTNDVTKEGLTEAARVVSHAAQGQKQNFVINLCQIKATVDFEVKERPDEVHIDQKVDVVLRANQTVRNFDNRIKQVSVGFGDIVQDVIIANSEGVYVEDQRIRNRFMVNAVAAEGPVIQTGYNAIGGFAGFEIFEEFTPEAVAGEAARRAILMLEAKPAPAGKMEVVMAGEAGGTMVHEACGHGLEADLAQKNLSVYSGKKGQKVASELITVIDDSTIANKYGSYSFDDEGVTSRKCLLIKDGELTDYLYDRLSARKEGRESNGHGRRESYQHKPIPRMGNTYIASGKEDPEAIIKS
ncbi:MAG: TldD/PmbA family protein, partial [Clostridia bacterium]|nr:TldD/PmbA family protein [Clostridia bacterium]